MIRPPVHHGISIWLEANRHTGVGDAIGAQVGELSRARTHEETHHTGLEAEVGAFDREVENLRSALMWAIDRDDDDHAIRTVCARILESIAVPRSFARSCRPSGESRSTPSPGS